MSMTTIRVEHAKQTIATSHAGDLLELVKPRISAMVLVTVALSVFVASQGNLDLLLLLHTLLGTALVAASSGAFNQLLECSSDARMERTAERPLPAGRLGAGEAITFGVATFVAGSAYLALTVGWQSMAWAVATWVVYVCFYTPMKTWTSWNTTVGAASGALPILIGSSAVGAPIDWHIGAMLAVLFFWQFPHFIAIAWIYRRQYEKAGLQMVTTTDPSGRTAGFYSVLGSGLLLASSLLPLIAGMSISYTLIAFVLGGYQMLAACRFQRALDDLTARRLLKASIIYLPLALGLIAVQTAL